MSILSDSAHLLGLRIMAQLQCQELANGLGNLTLPIDWIGLESSKFHRLLRELENP